MSILWLGLVCVLLLGLAAYVCVRVLQKNRADRAFKEYYALRKQENHGEDLCATARPIPYISHGGCEWEDFRLDHQGVEY